MSDLPIIEKIDGGIEYIIRSCRISSFDIGRSVSSDAHRSRKLCISISDTHDHEGADRNYENYQCLRYAHNVRKFKFTNGGGASINLPMPGTQARIRKGR